ncbi:MAG: hypothetical protein AB1750_21295, partial [Chloroflexota bacterium]
EIYNSPRMNEIRALMAQGRFEEIDACRECSFYHDWMKSPLAPNKTDWRFIPQPTEEPPLVSI